MATITRKTYTVDMTGKVLGRAASDIASHLIGKTNPAYQTNTDIGDNVVVTNVDKMIVTGNKIEDKVYHRHTGRPGGLRTKSLKEMWGKESAAILRQAVSRMLPKNKHRDARILRLTIE